MWDFIKKIFNWIMGEAPEGQRKMVFCTRIEIMLFTALMFSLPSPELVDILVNAMLFVGVTGVGGNGIEWVSKSFSSKAAATDVNLK